MEIVKGIKNKKLYKWIFIRNKFYTIIGTFTFTISLLLFLANRIENVKTKKEFFGSKLVVPKKYSQNENSLLKESDLTKSKNKPNISYLDWLKKTSNSPAAKSGINPELRFYIYQKNQLWKNKKKFYSPSSYEKNIKKSTYLITSNLEVERPFFNLDSIHFFNKRKENFLSKSTINNLLNDRNKNEIFEKNKNIISKEDQIIKLYRQQNNIYNTYLQDLKYKNDLKIARKYALSFFMFFGLLLFFIDFYFQKDISKTKN